jgi:hypothetical protein
VTATLREEFLSSGDIRIFIDGEDISCNEAELSKLTVQLMESYVPRRNPLERQSKHRSSDAVVWLSSEETTS